MTLKTFFTASPELPVLQLRLRQADLSLTHIGLLIVLVHCAGNGFPFMGFVNFLFSLAISTVWNLLSIKFHHKINGWVRIFFNMIVAGCFVTTALFTIAMVKSAEHVIDSELLEGYNALHDQQTSGAERANFMFAWETYIGPHMSTNVHQIVPKLLVGVICVLCGCIHFYLFVRSCIDMHRKRTGRAIPAGAGKLSNEV